MRYPKKQPLQCTVAWYHGKGYYCYNTKQKLGQNGSPNNPKCVSCREHYRARARPHEERLKTIHELADQVWDYMCKFPTVALIPAIEKIRELSEFKEDSE